VCHQLENCGYSLLDEKGLGGSSEHHSLYRNTKKSSLLSSFVQQMSEVLRLSMTWKDTDIMSAPEVITVWTVFLHPPNGPDLALSVCHVFGHLKKNVTVL